VLAELLEVAAGMFGGDVGMAGRHELSWASACLCGLAPA
jgi:hypothetical protein